MPLAAEQLSSQPSDAELIRRTRDGDADAYGALFARHADAARGLAARLTAGTPVAADDVVSDAFIGVLSAIRSGQGPEESFRAYLYTAVRNGAAALRAREGRSIAVDDPAEYEKPTEAPDPVLTAFESEVVQAAFASLPERWQAVLWYSEVETMKPAAIAPLLGVSPNGVSALLIRAREGLRDAYVVAHLGELGDARPECQWTAQRLGGHVRGTLARRDRRKVGTHLRECPDCVVMAAEAAEVQRGLILVIAPLVLGGAGAAWLATRRAPENTPTASGTLAGGAGRATVRAARLSPGRVVGLVAAAAVIATMVALAAVAMQTENPPPLAAPAEPTPDEAVTPPVADQRDEPADESDEQVEQEPVADGGADENPARPPVAGTPPAPSGPPPAEEPAETGPVSVTMPQSLIVGRVTVLTSDNPVLAVSGTVDVATVTWLADDPLLASLISFTVAAGHYTLMADDVVEETLPGGGVRYVSTADATAMAATFSNDTWLIDDTYGPIDWRLEVVESGADTGGVRLDGPLALTAGQQVSVALDAPGSGTAHVTTLDGTAVTSSVEDGVLLMQAAGDTTVQQVIVVFTP